MWISRAAFDEMQMQSSWLRTQLEIANAEKTHLTQEIIELKRDGFARPQPQMVQEYKGSKMDDRILAAIRKVADEGSPLERELVTFAESQILAEEEIEDIADRIMAGASIGDFE